MLFIFSKKMETDFALRIYSANYTNLVQQPREMDGHNFSLAVVRDVTPL